MEKGGSGGQVRALNPDRHLAQRILVDRNRLLPTARQLILRAGVSFCCWRVGRTNLVHDDLDDLRVDSAALRRKDVV